MLDIWKGLLLAAFGTQVNVAGRPGMRWVDVVASNFRQVVRRRPALLPLN